MLIARHVPYVHVRQAGLAPDQVSLFQTGQGRGRPVPHGKVRVEARNVPRGVRTQFLSQEIGQLAQFRRGVVEAWDKQRGHFQPPAQRPHPHQVMQHRLEPGTADPFVEFRGHGLEIDVGRVDAPPQGGQALRALEPIGDHDVFEPLFMGQVGRGRHELKKNRGLGIGIGNGGGAVTLGRSDQALGRDPVAAYGAALTRRLGQGVVLAEGTGEIAAHGAKRQGQAAGQEMIERLFFHRVEIERRHPVADQGAKRAVMAQPHPALAALALAQTAEMGAQLALDRAVPMPLPQGRRRKGPFLPWRS